jgi:hypothetical protein
MNDNYLLFFLTSPLIMFIIALMLTVSANTTHCAIHSSNNLPRLINYPKNRARPPVKNLLFCYHYYHDSRDSQDALPLLSLISRAYKGNIMARRENDIPRNDAASGRFFKNSVDYVAAKVEGTAPASISSLLIMKEVGGR